MSKAARVRQERIDRLGPKRVDKVVETMRVLGNLGEYGPTSEQAQVLLRPIYVALQTLEHALTGFQLPEADDPLPTTAVELRELYLQSQERCRQLQVQLELYRRENEGLLARLSKSAVQRAGGVYGD